jgi:hypothetical protein
MLIAFLVALSLRIMGSALNGCRTSPQTEANWEPVIKESPITPQDFFDGATP